MPKSILLIEGAFICRLDENICIHQPIQVDFVAFNPPGLTHCEARIYTANPAIVEMDLAGRTLQVISHYNDGAWSFGSRWIPPHASFLRHGDPHENPYIAHIKAADCSQAAPDLSNQDHEEPGVTYSGNFLNHYYF